MQPLTANELILLLDWIANAESHDAWEDLDEMVRNDPEQAWHWIRDMVDVAPSRLLGMIAAGPLEDLLHRHGKSFIGRVKKAAAADSQFQHCLSGVWLFEPRRLADQIRRAATSPSKMARRRRGTISKKRAWIIARWFHHSDTMWAPNRLNELILTDVEAAWRMILFLIRIANEEKPHVLDDIDALVFSKLVDVRGPELYERIIAEAKQNPTIKRWIEARRRWKYLDENWKGLLERYSSLRLANGPD
jgi:hypothetical protein